MRASGVMPSSLARSCRSSRCTAAAPSLSGHALPGGDRAVGTEHRLERARASRPSCRGAGRRPCVTTVPSGVVTGVISRSKKPFSCDFDRAVLRQRRELVHLLARHVARARRRSRRSRPSRCRRRGGRSAGVHWPCAALGALRRARLGVGELRVVRAGQAVGHARARSGSRSRRHRRRTRRPRRP